MKHYFDRTDRNAFYIIGIAMVSLAGAAAEDDDVSFLKLTGILGVGAFALFKVARLGWRIIAPGVDIVTPVGIDVPASDHPSSRSNPSELAPETGRSNRRGPTVQRR